MAVRSLRWSLLLVVLCVIAACDSSTSPNGGQARVFLTQASTSSAAMPGDADVINSSAPLTLAAVDSIIVTVTSVEAVPSGADSVGWQVVQLDSGSIRRINLLALPKADSIRLARGALKNGTYDHIRLRVNDSASIVLKQDVTVGNSNFVKGTYPLRIPSGQQTGLKIKTASFVVGNDSTKVVTLIFDAASSVGTIVATGAGSMQMSPVLRSKTP